MDRGGLSFISIISLSVFDKICDCEGSVCQMRSFYRAVKIEHPPEKKAGWIGLLQDNSLKKKKERERKRKLQFSGYAQRPRRLIQVHDQIFAVLFVLCLICPFFSSCMEWAFWSFSCPTSALVSLACRASVAVTQCCPPCLSLAFHFSFDVVWSVLSFSMNSNLP